MNASLCAATKLNEALWTIAENLHRAGLTKLQRSELVNKWAKLIKQRAKAVQVAQPGGRQRNDKGLSKTAKQLGISREKVGRSKKIAGISSEAKTAAKAAGLDDNQEALLKIAKASTSKGQLKKVAELAESKKTASHGALQPGEKKKLKTLKKAYARAREFRKVWTRATAVVRQKFIKTVLKPSA